MSHAPANQQAGSRSGPKEVEGNMEEGSFLSQVRALWERRMGKLRRQPVAPVSGLSPDAHLPMPSYQWGMDNMVTENGYGSFWGYEEVTSLGAYGMSLPTKSKHPFSSKGPHNLLR